MHGCGGGRGGRGRWRHLRLQVAVGKVFTVHDGQAIQQLGRDGGRLGLRQRLREAGLQVAAREILHGQMDGLGRLEPAVELHKDVLVLVRDVILRTCGWRRQTAMARRTLLSLAMASNSCW